MVEGTPAAKALWWGKKDVKGAKEAPGTGAERKEGQREVKRRQERAAPLGTSGHFLLRWF